MTTSSRQHLYRNSPFEDRNRSFRSAPHFCVVCTAVFFLRITVRVRFSSFWWLSFWWSGCLTGMLREGFPSFEIRYLLRVTLGLACVVWPNIFATVQWMVPG